jgi:hypothetical protein
VGQIEEFGFKPSRGLLRCIWQYISCRRIRNEALRRVHRVGFRKYNEACIEAKRMAKKNIVHHEPELVED